MTAIDALRRYFCRHEFNYRYDTVGRTTPDGDVSCPCWKCGKMFSAPYGLALPGKLVQIKKLEKESK